MKQNIIAKELEQRLRRKFGLSADQNVLADVQQCLQEMKDKGLAGSVKQF